VLILLARKPYTNPPTTTLESILLKASITRTKRRGKRGPPWRMPCELLKKPYRLPLIKMEKRAVKMHAKIHFLHLAPKPHHLKTYKRKSQFFFFDK